MVRVDSPENRARVARLMREYADRAVLEGPTPEMVYGEKAVAPTGGYLHVPITKSELRRFASLLEQHPRGRIGLNRQADISRFHDAIHELNRVYGYLGPRSQRDAVLDRLPIDLDEEEMNARPRTQNDINGDALIGVSDMGSSAIPRIEHRSKPLPGVGVYRSEAVRAHFRRGSRGFYGPVSRYRRVAAKERSIPGGTGGIGPIFGTPALKVLEKIGDPKAFKRAYDRAPLKVKQEVDAVRGSLTAEKYKGR